MELELCISQTPEMGRYQQRPCSMEFGVVSTLTTSSRWSQQLLQKSGRWHNGESLHLALKQKVIRQGSVLSDRILTLQWHHSWTHTNNLLVSLWVTDFQPSIVVHHTPPLSPHHYFAGKSFSTSHSLKTDCTIHAYFCIAKDFNCTVTHSVCMKRPDAFSAQDLLCLLNESTLC